MWRVRNRVRKKWRGRIKELNNISVRRGSSFKNVITELVILSGGEVRQLRMINSMLGGRGRDHYIPAQSDHGDGRTDEIALRNYGGDAPFGHSVHDEGVGAE